MKKIILLFLFWFSLGAWDVIPNTMIIVGDSLCQGPGDSGTGWGYWLSKFPPAGIKIVPENFYLLYTDQDNFGLPSRCTGIDGCVAGTLYDPNGTNSPKWSISQMQHITYINYSGQSIYSWTNAGTYTPATGNAYPGLNKCCSADGLDCDSPTERCGITSDCSGADTCIQPLCCGPTYWGDCSGASPTYCDGDDDCSGSDYCWAFEDAPDRLDASGYNLFRLFGYYRPEYVVLGIGYNDRTGWPTLIGAGQYYGPELGAGSATDTNIINAHLNLIYYLKGTLAGHTSEGSSSTKIIVFTEPPVSVGSNNTYYTVFKNLLLQALASANIPSVYYYDLHQAITSQYGSASAYSTACLYDAVHVRALYSGKCEEDMVINLIRPFIEKVLALNGHITNVILVPHN